MILIIVIQLFFLLSCLYCNSICLNSNQKRRGRALDNTWNRPLLSRVHKVILPDVKCTVLTKMSQSKHWWLMKFLISWVLVCQGSLNKRNLCSHSPKVWSKCFGRVSAFWGLCRKDLFHFFLLSMCRWPSSPCVFSHYHLSMLIWVYKFPFFFYKDTIHLRLEPSLFYFTLVTSIKSLSPNRVTFCGTCG